MDRLHTCSWDLARNPGVCADQESTGDLRVHRLALSPLNHTSQ